MKTSNPLRKIGPRIFISYSFSDMSVADSLGNYLSEAGFQVHKEDETSLLGQNLRVILPQRIGNAEVVIPLLTSTSNKSTWVRHEIDWALEQKQQNDNLLILPIVFDQAGLYEPIKDWVYINATEGLTDTLLDLARRSCLQVITPLPLAKKNIFDVDPLYVANLLKSNVVNSKRVIVDADGVLLTLIDETIEIARQSDTPTAKAFQLQEEKRRARIAHLLSLADLIIPKLVEELRFYFSNYGLQFPERATEAINRFNRQIIGRELLKIADVLPSSKSDLLTSILPQIEAAIHTIEELQHQDPGHTDFGKIAWVLGKRPSDNSQDWIQIGFQPGTDKQGVTMYFPQTGIGSDWQLILQMGERPENIIYPHDWADFCLPQLASRAVGLMYSHSLTLEQAIDSIAWKLSEYRVMGLP